MAKITGHLRSHGEVGSDRRSGRVRLRRPTLETAMQVKADRPEPRVCAMVKAPTPEEEDRRRLCRERKAPIAERVRHANRIKGLLFCQGVSGYAPPRRNRRQRLAS